MPIVQSGRVEEQDTLLDEEERMSLRNHWEPGVNNPQAETHCARQCSLLHKRGERSRGAELEMNRN